MIKILVVEDDLNTRKLMCAVLTRSGFETYGAEDSMAALRFMEKQHIDLVVLDLMMPNMDGYELTRQLRLSWADLPILCNR